MICHNNDTGWWENEEKLAREQGLDMWSEYYPYTADSSSIGSEMLLPETFEPVLGFSYEESVYDPYVRVRRISPHVGCSLDERSIDRGLNPGPRIYAAGAYIT